MAALLALPFGAPSSAALQPLTSDAPGDLASPSILAAFYSYDGCVGASTLDAAELRSRRCTVLDDNSTNVRMVGDVMKLCASFCQSGLSGVSVDNLVSLDPWLDSLLVTLTHPVVESSIDKHDFKVVVWDEASKSSTEAEVKCVSLWPSGEGNELSTLNLIGDFGDGYGGTRWPTHLKIVRRRRSYPYPPAARHRCPTRAHPRPLPPPQVSEMLVTLADGTEADVRPDNGTLVYSNAAGFAYNNSTTELLRATLRSFSEEGEFTNDADKVLSLGTGGKAYAATRSLGHSLRRTLSDAASPHPLAGTPTTARSISTRRRT